jgi:hypothetical protein
MVAVRHGEDPLEVLRELKWALPPAEYIDLLEHNPPALGAWLLEMAERMEEGT